MKDARGITISIGQSVALLSSKEMFFGRQSNMAWGTVKRLTEKRVIVEYEGQYVKKAETSRDPHNVLVVQFDVEDQNSDTL